MKAFLKFFAVPLLIAVIASALYLIDCLVAGLFVKGATFLWAAFIIWTIFYGAKVKDRVKGLIGVVIGFLAAVLMMTITGSFTLNLATVSISCLLGIFVVNAAVMFLDKLDKFWLSSITGVFAGIALTFSGLGIGLSPMVSFSSALTMIGILVVYTILGLLCGYFSTLGTEKIKAKLAELEPQKDKEKENKTEK